MEGKGTGDDRLLPSEICQLKIFGAVTWFLEIALGFGEIYNWDGDNGNGIGMRDLGI